MILSKREIEIKPHTKHEIAIRQITDIHEGNHGFHKNLLNKFLKIQEQDKSSFWLCTGDMIDADRPSMRDRKAAIHAEADRKDSWTQEDYRNLVWLDKEVIPKYRPIAKQCLGILDGDHYLLFSNGMTSGEYVCRKLGVPYLGERLAYIGLLFKYGENQRALYTILARHGKGFASTSGGDIAALERQSQGWEADLFLGGHTHKENIHPLQIMRPDKSFNNIKQRIVWYVRGGSFLCGYPTGKTTYAELAEYSPLVTGWAEVNLYLSKRQCNNGDLYCEAQSAKLIAA